MILVDTSVWVDHLRSGLPHLTTALDGGKVLIHPWVIGELACGNLHDRGRVLELLQGLTAATVASDSEVLQLIEQQKLMGRGIGYVDAHLLASARLLLIKSSNAANLLARRSAERALWRS